MKKVLVCAAIAAVVATTATANMGGAKYPVTGCGLGYMLFTKEKPNDLVMNIVASTFNGTLGNQTFGMTTGTSGCNPGGVWAQNEELNNFASQNLEKLAADMAKGEGETLDAFADLAGVNDKPAFFAATQANFDKIFTKSDITAGEVLANMDQVL
ncbi:MAG: DUF3015 domain-containing protein [Helicobacteraceae bacterium]|jgi:hypothetical protein|nr:DUF3015 domain-containing protein [Helicobacteraceae bacterium]